jgi:hypothetical protein
MDATLDEHGPEAKRQRQEGEFGHRWVWGLLPAAQVALVKHASITYAYTYAISQLSHTRFFQAVSEHLQLMRHPSGSPWASIANVLPALYFSTLHVPASNTPLPPNRLMLKHAPTLLLISAL